MGQRMTRRQVAEGLELYAEKNYDGAIKKWTTALPKMKDSRLRFATLGYLALASRDRGRNKDYLVHAVQQIDIAHELDDNTLRAQAYLNLSRANEMLADYFKAVSYSRSAMQYSPTGDSIQGYALLVMADSYIGLCNFPKVLECLDKALSISHENEDHLMEIQVLNTTAKVFLALKDFPKALAFQRRAHDLAVSTAAYAGETNTDNCTKFLRLTKLKLATPLRLMGDYEGATKCVEEAMRAASSIGDRPVQAKCLVCVGDIQRSQKNYEVHSAACPRHRTAMCAIADCLQEVRGSDSDAAGHERSIQLDTRHARFGQNALGSRHTRANGKREYAKPRRSIPRINISIRCLWLITKSCSDYSCYVNEYL